MMEDEETTNRESSLLPHEAATGKPPPDPLAASLEKVGALSVEHARRMVRSTETSRRSREGGSASAIMSQLSLASEHAREIVGSILDGKAMGGEEAPSFQRPPHQLSDSQACGSPTPEAELRPCQGGEGEAWQDAAGKSSPPLSPAHTRMVPAEVVEQLQRQQQQRLEEMAEGARQLTRQKDKEIKQLTESMQAMLKEAAEREETAFR
ncbi:hypothetical protein GUITHDRAFT_108422 [Guillardia theta CCMP2712]|uniref:Uncharacterized protein n=1 Tax=Guillardia theta (strain CCMP2712) TaxID=905079 RepID=L1JAH5_GUITC|nr:hypothetical protein GUITHDRAFT_108422 [Guillardia theta CCMP2712]EKX45548.1 hypothetical protein GUITHDRAFT_108422 [Guillardia theta CCMP2712]|eukprot:XP_005832528.1 hypothetical protein GUITHDRAFT_108422 [Guillardia theta CCMP2712]